MSTRREPRGQVLVITAAALVILLGIAALVVDLGFAVLLRRQEQNAVDPGSIAAARFIDDVTGQSIDMPNAWQAACHYARQNTFFPGAIDNGSGPTGCVPANDPFDAALEVIYPPDGRAGQFQGHQGFVQVVLTRERDTFFGRVLGFGTLSVSTDAVAARQRGNTNTHSLIALNPYDCATGWLHGNGTVSIYPALGYTGDGGYVQINSSCGAPNSGDDQCDNGSGGLRIDGTTTQLTAPKVNVHGGCRSQNTNGIVGILDEAQVQIGDPLSGLIPPSFNPSAPGASCGTSGGTSGPPTQPTGNASKGCGRGGGPPWVAETDPAERDAICPGLNPAIACVHLLPGVYFGGWVIGSKTSVVLDPGIYFIAGGGVTITSGTGALQSVDSGGGTPAPVLIYNTDNPNYSCPGDAWGCQADLDFTAEGSLNLAPLLATQPCPPVTFTGGCPYGGMVIWYDAKGSQSPTYSGYVDIEGGVELYISGTIYAPTATVDIHGNVTANCDDANPTQVAAVQIIAWQWKLGGTGDLCMPYDPSKLYHLTLQGLVH